MTTARRSRPRLSRRCALSCAGVSAASASRLLPLRAPHQLSRLGARLGRRLQEPAQQRIEALGGLVVVASLIAHGEECSMAPADGPAPRMVPFASRYSYAPANR